MQFAFSMIGMNFILFLIHTNHKIHVISIMSSLSPNKKRVIVTSSLSPKKKRKHLSSSTSSGNNSMVYLHGKEHREGIFVAYFSISWNGSNGDRSFFIQPFQNAAKKFMSGRADALYPGTANLFDFGSLFRVDNCYFRSAHGSHTEYRRQKRDSNFYWPCFVWTRPETGSECDWTLEKWLENFKNEFLLFVSWTKNHPSVYKTWKFGNPDIAIKTADVTLRGNEPLAEDLTDTDVLNVIFNSHENIVESKADLLNNKELMIRYFGSDSVEVQRRIENAFFPQSKEE